MIRLFSQYFPYRSIVMRFYECLFVAFALIISLNVHGQLQDYHANGILLAGKIAMVLMLFEIALYFSDLSLYRKNVSITSILRQVARFLIFVVLFIVLPFRLASTELFSTKVLLSTLLLSPCLIIPWGHFYYWFTNRVQYKKRTVIIGAGRLAKNIARESLADKNLSLHIVGFISDDPELRGVRLVNPGVIGNTAELPLIIADHQVEKIIVAMEEKRGTLPLQQLLAYKTRGISIEEGVSYYEKITNKLLVEHLNPSDIIFSSHFTISPLNLCLKRSCDVLLASIGLIIAAPILPLLALLIKMESDGPIFFRQERVGQHEKIFRICKLRTMHKDAEKVSGPVMSFSGDARITRVGKFLRKTRLDEIPQLINILKGDMSFVGPRPEREVFVGKFKQQIPFYAQRFSVRPGLTGWAQIKYHYASTLEHTIEKLRYELFYIKNFSLLFDIAIILRTIKVILFARGA